MDEELIKNSSIFNFVTLSLTHDGVCAATEKAVNVAKENGVLISFDPNLRIPLWKDLSVAKEKMEYGLSKCDVCKISEEEVEFLTGEKDIDSEWESYKASLESIGLSRYLEMLQNAYNASSFAK